MSDEYLWDKSGEPDPEVRHLEEQLAPLAYRPRGPRAAPRGRWPLVVAIAAAIAVASGVLLLWTRSRPTGPMWDVVTMDGSGKLDKMSRGGAVETDAYSRLRLELESYGKVEVDPNTKLKLLESKEEVQRMSLLHGRIRAEIWAPPGRFLVNTPSAVAVDLGCAYTLDVDDRGVGTVRVDFGWVAFEDHGKESLIPAHAVCITRPGLGPGIPCYEDASQDLQSAVARFDTSRDLGAIPTILSRARGRDAVTLWHLLRRAPPELKGEIYDHLAQLVDVPKGVSRDGVVAGDSKQIDLLWNSLGLGDIAWWRMWKR